MHFEIQHKRFRRRFDSSVRWEKKERKRERNICVYLLLEQMMQMLETLEQYARDGQSYLEPRRREQGNGIDGALYVSEAVSVWKHDATCAFFWIFSYMSHGAMRFRFHYLALDASSLPTIGFIVTFSIFWVGRKLFEAIWGKSLKQSFVSG
jgi:hypothetical protein